MGSAVVQGRVSTKRVESHRLKKLEGSTPSSSYDEDRSAPALGEQGGRRD